MVGGSEFGALCALGRIQDPYSEGIYLLFVLAKMVNSLFRRRESLMRLPLKGMYVPNIVIRVAYLTFSTMLRTTH